MALRSAPRAIVMGSQPAGADGDISRVPFPGGVYSPFSGLGIYYPDGKDTQGVGIIPDINVYLTQKGIATGKDEILEKAKEYISKAKLFEVPDLLILVELFFFLLFISETCSWK